MSTGRGTPDEATRPLRADAARNRELILATAAAVFAERGLDAGYDEIARRAGIGVGTVYRRFPERAELIEALFLSRVEEMVVIAEEAAVLPDAWSALTWFLEKAVEQQVADRGLRDVMVRSITRDAQLSVGRERLGPIIKAIVARAKAEGTLRPDVESTDLGMQLMVMSSMTTRDQPELWRRHFGLLLEGLRSRPGQEPLPLEAPPDDAVHELIHHLQGRPA